MSKIAGASVDAKKTKPPADAATKDRLVHYFPVDGAYMKGKTPAPTFINLFDISLQLSKGLALTKHT